VWDAAGVFPPSVDREDDRGRPYYIYSFRDVVGLSILARLRQEHGIAPAELRRFGAWRTQRYREPWSSIRFAVSGKRVMFDESGAGVPPCRGEPCREYDTLDFARQTAIDTHRLAERLPEEIGTVTRSRYVAFGKPMLAGTRILTTTIWNLTQAGYDTNAILERYPYLSPDDVEAALEFEARGREAPVA